MSEGKIRLHMTAKEIVDSYRNAVDQKVQVKILAELNAVSPAVIREVLKDRGIELPEEKKKRVSGRRKLDEEAFMRLYDQGYDDAAIAEGLRCCVSTVKNYRREKGLPMMGDKRINNGSRSKKKSSRREAAERRKLWKWRRWIWWLCPRSCRRLKKAFPDTPVSFAAGKACGAVLMVRWDAEGDIRQTDLVIEAKPE